MRFRLEQRHTTLDHAGFPSRTLATAVFLDLPADHVDLPAR